MARARRKTEPPVPGASSVCLQPLRALFDRVPIAMMAVDAEERITALNGHAERLLGYTEAELAGRRIGELAVGARARSRDAANVHPWLDPACAGPLLSRTSQDDRHLHARRKDGSEFPIEIGLVDAQPGLDAERLLTMVDLSARKAVETRLVKLTLELAERTSDLEERRSELQAEIEQRRRAEADLERSHEDFRYLFQHNPLPMWLFDTRTLRFLEVNQAAVAQYGYTRAEFLAMTIRDIRPPDEIERLENNLAMIRSRSAMDTANWKHRDKSGRTFAVDIFSRALGDGAHSARLVVAIDVTQRNAAEAQLRQAQKMEAVGQLTGGIAHDFNNLLSIILGNLELVAQQAGEGSVIAALTAEALDSVHRGAGLTRRLLAFSRQQPLEPRVVDTAGMIGDMSALLRRSLDEAIRIERDLSPDLWHTRVDSSQMENALLNLAVNARDAMPAGGTLTIEAKNIVADGDYAGVVENVAPGEYVQIAVSDTGAGIPAEVLEHILEPFFTTKPPGKGSGLGLSMVYGFSKQSGGYIKIYSEVGVGTTVKLLLPRAFGEPEAAEAHVEAPRDAMPRAAHGEVVLLVEDDAAIRKLVARMLQVLGYRALTATDASSALAALHLAPRVDLLFTDVVLPNGTGGAALAREARKRHPELRVLYMSGYTRNALLQHQVQDEHAHILSKPFRKEELAQAVARVLHAPPRR